MRQTSPMEFVIGRERTPARRGSIASALLGSELTIVLMVLVALGAALLAGAEPQNANAGAAPSKTIPIRGIAVTGPDQSMVAVLSDDRCIIHDRRRFESFGVWLRSGDEHITAMAASPTESRLFLCQDASRMHLLDTHSGKMLWTQNSASGYPASATYSPDGAWIAVGTEQGRILLVANDTGTTRHEIHADDAVHAVCFTPDSTQFLAPLSNTELGVWDVSTGRKVRSIRLDNLPGRVIAMALHADGERIALGTAEGVVSLRNLSTDEEIRRMQKSYLPMLNVAFNPDGNDVIAAGCDGNIHILAFDASIEIRSFKAHHDAVRSIAFVGKTIISGGYDGAVRKWDLRTSQELSFDGHL